MTSDDIHWRLLYQRTHKTKATSRTLDYSPTLPVSRIPFHKLRYTSNHDNSRKAARCQTMPPVSSMLDDCWSTWFLKNMSVFYSAACSRLDRSNRLNTLFLPWQTCSFRQQLDYSGKQVATQQLLHEVYSPTFPPLSIARYSFIQLSDLRRRGENENAQTSKR